MINPPDPCSLCYGYCSDIDCCVNDFEYTDDDGQLLTGVDAYYAYIDSLYNKRNNK